MKKLFFIISVLISLQLSMHGEDKVFPESDAIWNVHMYIDGYFYDNYIYGLSGDTIINEKKYNKLYLLNDSTLNIDHNDIYVGGLREENQQIWFLIHDHLIDSDYGLVLEEYILYDFSKKEGDTFVRNNVLSFNPYAGWLETIYSIEEVTAVVKKVEQTFFGKEMHLEYYPRWGGDGKAIWIEGIGSTKGIVWDQFEFPMCEYGDFKLACFQKGDEVIYNDNEYGCCFCDYNSGGGVSIDQPVFPSILIAADKSSASIKILSNQFPLSIELINLQGQSILKEEIVSHPQSVSYAGLNKGLYLYRISDKDIIIQTGKILLP